MKKAFTLIELLVVVIIISVLVIIMMPHYQRVIWRARLAEVYNTVGHIAKMQKMYHLEHGRYAVAPNGQSYAGNGIPDGSSLIQAALAIDIPSESYFLYSILPDASNPNETKIYFKQPNHEWAWSYDYDAKTWSEYTSGDGGPAREYFIPPGR